MFDQEFADKKPAAHDALCRLRGLRHGSRRTRSTRQTKIKRFKKEEFPQILVSVNMLDTGFDCPEVVNLVMARFTHSPRSCTSRCAAAAPAGPTTSRRPASPCSTSSASPISTATSEELAGGRGRRAAADGSRKPQAAPAAGPGCPRRDRPTTREWVTVDEQGTARHGLRRRGAGRELGVRFEAWLAEQDLTREQERLLRMIEAADQGECRGPDELRRLRASPAAFSLQGRLRRGAGRVFGGEAEHARPCSPASSGRVRPRRRRRRSPPTRRPANRCTTGDAKRCP